MKRLTKNIQRPRMAKSMLKWCVIMVVLLSACSKSGEGTTTQMRPHFERNYTFSNGKIPRNVLDSYLSRSILQAEYLNSEGFYNDGPYPYKADDFRMLKELGAKFIGRAIYSWDIPEAFANPAFLGNAKERVEEVHAYDSEVIFQACLFEIVSTKVEQIQIPAWVFEAFDLPAENRNFDYNEMLSKEGKFVNHWRVGASVPDIRENVLCDGHMGSGGFVRDGKLLFDFVSFPMRIKEIIGDPQKGELKKFHLDAIYGRTKGGITPSGWTCDRAPYIVELDNFGIGEHPGTPNLNDHFVWGFDEISWFTNQPEAYRNAFLAYADDWIERVDPNGFIQMPGSRVTSGTSGNRYRANAPSDACPIGMGQEQVIKEIWAQ